MVQFEILIEIVKHSAHQDLMLKSGRKIQGFMKRLRPLTSSPPLWPSQC